MTGGAEYESVVHHVESVAEDTFIHCPEIGATYGPGTEDQTTPTYCPYCSDRATDASHRIAMSRDEVFCDHTTMSTWRYCPGCGEEVSDLAE